MLNFTATNPFPTNWENYDAGRHDPQPRKPASAIHPEDKK